MTTKDIPVSAVRDIAEALLEYNGGLEDLARELTAIADSVDESKLATAITINVTPDPEEDDEAEEDGEGDDQAEDTQPPSRA